MRASLTHARAGFLVHLTTTWFVVLAGTELDSGGYYAELGFQEDAFDVEDINATCPTDRVLRVRDTCREHGVEMQCIKLKCCHHHVYISGRCISKDIDPCSLQLCEQACSVIKDQLWCSCHAGYRFHDENYRLKTQPFCVDIDECAVNNGGCSHTCVNDPGRHHCLCPLGYKLDTDERSCVPYLMTVPMAPLPLTRQSSSRCFSSCETVLRLSRKVDQLTTQLAAALKKAEENPAFTGEERFGEGTHMYRVLDSTAPLEGGYCRCERGPRGPPGAPGMEGPRGATGERGPRGSRGPKGSLDVMLLLLADLRHDIHNLEAKVYKDGEYPERFNLQKAWRHQRKQQMSELAAHTDQPLETSASPLQSTNAAIEVVHNSETGEIHRDFDSTTDWTLVKGDTESYELDNLRDSLNEDIDAKLKQFYILVNTTSSGDDDEEDFPDYAFY